MQAGVCQEDLWVFSNGMQTPFLIELVCLDKPRSTLFLQSRADLLFPTLNSPLTSPPKSFLNARDFQNSQPVNLQGRMGH